MTRTARAAYPRAIIKDRSESRSGLDNSLRKGGAGHHNWGSLADERQLESAALNDGDFYVDEEGPEPASDDVPARVQSPASVSTASSKAEGITRNISGASSMTEEELEEARKFRKHAFKKATDLDLSAIARTSAAVSVSPPSPDAVRRSGHDNKQIPIADATTI